MNIESIAAALKTTLKKAPSMRVHICCNCHSQTFLVVNGQRSMSQNLADCLGLCSYSDPTESMRSGAPQRQILQGPKL